jgi:hypothetical protein
MGKLQSGAIFLFGTVLEHKTSDIDAISATRYQEVVGVALTLSSCVSI